MDKVVMALSGGLDSTTLLAYLLHKEHEVILINFKYGSKHNTYEISAARKIAEYYGMQLREIDISNCFEFTKSNLLLSGGDIPEGHYEAESMKQTVVPGRNLTFLAIMSSIAESYQASSVAIGVHKGDHHIYPDCRFDFITYAEKTIRLSTDNKVTEIKAPFILDSKEGIVKLGMKLSVPFHLTRTCYKDQLVACGKCGSCQERLEAFRLNNRVDPERYEGEFNV